MDLLRFVVTRHFDDLVAAGAPKALARDLSLKLEDDIRQQYGGANSYVPSISLSRRNKVIRNAWASAVERNAQLQPSQKLTVTALRDRVCNDHGISRDTLRRILAD